MTLCLQLERNHVLSWSMSLILTFDLTRWWFRRFTFRYWYNCRFLRVYWCLSGIRYGEIGYADEPKLTRASRRWYTYALYIHSTQRSKRTLATICLQRIFDSRSWPSPRNGQIHRSKAAVMMFCIEMFPYRIRRHSLQFNKVVLGATCDLTNSSLRTPCFCFMHSQIVRIRNDFALQAVTIMYGQGGKLFMCVNNLGDIPFCVRHCRDQNTS